MKTQLLQDIDESGAFDAPRGLPVRTPRPRVWRRPQGPVQAPARPDPAPPVAPARPFPADPAPPASDPAEIPSWLAERLQEDALRDERAQWRGTWQRRAFAWGGAACLLALVAAGGLWLAEQNRVDGALVVVANTTPEVHAPVAPLPPPMMPTPAAPALTDPFPKSIQEPAPQPTDAATPVTPKAEAARPRKPPMRAQPVRRAAAQPQEAANARRQREETMLQCRARGYAERQCVQRGCAMTRFGFACKG